MVIAITYQCMPWEFDNLFVFIAEEPSMLCCKPYKLNDFLISKIYIINIHKQSLD